MPESARTPTTEWYRSSLSMLHSKSLDSRSSPHLYLKQKRGIYFQSIKIGKVIVLASLSSWHNWKTSCNYLPFESKMCHTQQILETSASAGSLHHSCHFSKKDSGKCWQDSAMNRAFKPFSPHTSGSSLSLCHTYSCAVKYIKVHFKKSRNIANKDISSNVWFPYLSKKKMLRVDNHTKTTLGEHIPKPDRCYRKASSCPSCHYQALSDCAQ